MFRLVDDLRALVNDVCSLYHRRSNGVEHACNMKRNCALFGASAPHERCLYFESCVLPSATLALQRKYLAETVEVPTAVGYIVICASCGNHFVRREPGQVVCGDCSAKTEDRAERLATLKAEREAKRERRIAEAADKAPKPKAAKQARKRKESATDDVLGVLTDAAPKKRGRPQKIKADETVEKDD